MTLCVIDGKQCQCQPDEGLPCTAGGSAQVQAALNAEIMALRKDAERLDFLMRAVSGAEFRRIGIVYSGNCTREAIDNYRTPRRGSGAA